ncbi:MAG: nucleotidyl transferase AbiEii/AbiGii toxin family protein [Desulforhabdus sp.]|jgi:predicted nucleotidyltransferase component of viral defense system|nr:nucleotidyl transferase AbiEii/AbiGii toxin family protein [Desulforhabdus sp.]
MNESALKERLKTISKEMGITFNDCWKRLLLERFLARIASSKHKEKLIFKGGFLLSYLLDTNRETVDLDFLLTKLKAQADGIRAVIEEIAAVDLKDGFTFSWSSTEELSQPHMEYTGFRVRLTANFGNVRDGVQIDLGIGDEVTPEKRNLKLFSYKGKPMFEDDISLLVYPIESVFAEKLHALVSHGKANSRMKDYHDMFVMVRDNAIKSPELRRAIEVTFGQRDQAFTAPIEFATDELDQLQRTWNLYRGKQKEANLPTSIQDVIDTINGFLETI